MIYLHKRSIQIGKILFAISFIPLTIQSLISCSKKTETDSISIEQIKKENANLKKSNKWCFIFDTNYIDIGTFKPEDDVAIGVFRYENHTGSPQFIDTIETSCGCTMAYYKNQVIQDGDKDSILIKIDLRGQRGGFIQIARVYFHSDSIQPVTLIIKGSKEF